MTTFIVCFGALIVALAAAAVTTPVAELVLNAIDDFFRPRFSKGSRSQREVLSVPAAITFGASRPVLGGVRGVVMATAVTISCVTIQASSPQNTGTQVFGFHA